MGLVVELYLSCLDILYDVAVVAFGVEIDATVESWCLYGSHIIAILISQDGIVVDGRGKRDVLEGEPYGISEPFGAADNLEYARHIEGGTGEIRGASAVACGIEIVETGEDLAERMEGKIGEAVEMEERRLGVGQGETVGDTRAHELTETLGTDETADELVLVGREGVVDEYVDEDAAVVGSIDIGGKESRSPVISHLSVPAQVEAVGIGALEEKGVCELLWRDGEEAVVVLARHEEIDVVIPGDIALMADCAEESASIGPDGDVMFLADLEDASDNSELNVPHALHLGRHSIAVSYFFVKIHCFSMLRASAIVDAILSCIVPDTFHPRASSLSVRKTERVTGL